MRIRLGMIALLLLGALLSMGNARDPKWDCADKKAGDSCDTYMSCSSGTCRKIQHCTVNPKQSETCLRCQ